MASLWLHDLLIPMSSIFIANVNILRGGLADIYSKIVSLFVCIVWLGCTYLISYHFQFSQGHFIIGSFFFEFPAKNRSRKIRAQPSLKEISFVFLSLDLKQHFELLAQLIIEGRFHFFGFLNQIIKTEGLSSRGATVKIWACPGGWRTWERGRCRRLQTLWSRKSQRARTWKSGRCDRPTPASFRLGLTSLLLLHEFSSGHWMIRFLRCLKAEVHRGRRRWSCSVSTTSRF